VCQLVIVPAKYHLNQHEEKAEYDLHQNDPANLDYQAFLSRTLKPLFSQLAKANNANKKPQGLDFGCGPGPCISQMAKEQGIQVNDYDLYYFNEQSLLENQYNFVTMTEVIEHIAAPQKLLELLDSLLLPDAILAVMTKRVTDVDAFSDWHYKNDPTHISFYSVETFQWIAQKMHWRLEIIDKDVVFFHKS
jgi:2-polyprenyl-3-methyl-5-hydroxy-6-metoxy-1,4-benzoquinol methylase